MYFGIRVRVALVCLAFASRRCILALHVGVVGNDKIAYFVFFFSTRVCA